MAFDSAARTCDVPCLSVGVELDEREEGTRHGLRTRCSELRSSGGFWSSAYEWCTGSSAVMVNEAKRWYVMVVRNDVLESLCRREEGR